MLSKIKMCSTAKDTWKKLIQLCEGDDQIKENKLYVAIHKFDYRMMKSGESMSDFDDV